MADLGSINTYSPRVLNHDTTKISGVVSEAFAPVARRCVRLYLRSTGAFLNQTYSRQDGSYVLTTLRTLEGQTVYVVAFNDDSAVPFNALIFDKLTPA